MTNRLHALVVVATLAGGLLPGCSLVLDPDTCSSDTECGAGTCQSGICVGPQGGAGGTGGEGGTADADADVDRGAPDLGGEGGGGGAAPDTGPGGSGGGGMGGSLDGGPPDPVAPRCTITSPEPDDRLVNAPEVAFTIKVEDADTAPTDLQVEFGPSMARQAISLDEAGEATVQQVVEAGVTVFSLRAVDGDDLACSATITIVADFEGPTLSLTVPAAASTETNDTPFTLEGTIDDANPARVLEVTIDGAPVIVEPTWLDRGRTFNAAVDLAPGANTVTVLTYDAAGNASEPASVELTLDQEAPVLTIDAPIQGAVLYTPTLAISGAVQQADGAPEVTAALQITITGEQAGQRNRAQNVRTDRDGRFSVEGRELYQGANQIEICANDPAGNEACTVLGVRRETAVPCVAIESPVDGAVVGSDQIEITGTHCPVVDTVSVSINDGPPVAAQLADGRFTAQVALPGSGQHEVRVTAGAPDGATARDSVNVILDDTPPTLRVSRPSERACVIASDIEVCGTATDVESDIAALTVNGVAAEGVAGGVFCVTVQTDEGFEQALEVVATNGAGLQTATTVLVDADASPPELTIDNSNGAWTGINDVGRVSITGHVDVGFCGVASVFVTIGAVRLEAGLEPNGDWRHARQVPDGIHQVLVETTDRAGQAAEATVEIRVDSTAPLIEDIQPAEPRLVSVGFTEVSARVSDGQGSGIVFGSINGQEVEIRGGRIRLPIPVPEGASDLTFLVRDLVGNTREETVRIYRDVTGPVVTLTSPEADANVPTPLVVTGTVDDGENGSGVRRVEVNGELAQVAQDGTWRAFNVPIDPLDPRIVATAVDNEGNASAEAAERTVRLGDFALLDAQTYGTAGAASVSTVILGDYSGSGRLDILALSEDAETPSRIFRQQNGGLFQGLSADVSGLDQLGATDGAQAADFDSDGVLDLLAWGPGFVSLWLGDGQGGFVGPGDNLPDNAGHTDVIVGDFSRDGSLDLLLLAGAASRVYYGRVDNVVFIPDTPDLLGLSDLPSVEHGQMVDLDGDGLLDLVAAGPTGLRVWSGSVDPRFTATQHFEGAGFQADQVLAWDADRDGVLDVSTLRGADSQTYGGDLVDGLAAPTAGPGAEGDRAMAVIDLDGDARDDLVFATATGLRAVHAEADGSFTPFDLAAAGVPALGPLNTVKVVDLDDDGDLDLVAGGPNGIFVVASNMSATHADTWLTVRLDARRALPLEPGPRDGLGITVYQNLSGGPVAERVVVANASYPTVITLPAPDESTEIEARYVDRGNRGAFVNPLGLIRAGLRVVINDPGN